MEYETRGQRAAWRCLERRLRAWAKHERLTVAMVPIAHDSPLSRKSQPTDSLLHPLPEPSTTTPPLRPPPHHNLHILTSSHPCHAVTVSPSHSYLFPPSSPSHLLLSPEGHAVQRVLVARVRCQWLDSARVRLILARSS